jgi:hypothetical protein
MHLRRTISADTVRILQSIRPLSTTERALTDPPPGSSFPIVRVTPSSFPHTLDNPLGFPSVLRVDAAHCEPLRAIAQQIPGFLGRKKS